MSVMSETNVKLLEKLFERKPEYNAMSFEEMVRVSTELSEKGKNYVNEALLTAADVKLLEKLFERKPEYNTMPSKDTSRVSAECPKIFNYEKYARAYDYLATGYSYGYEASLLMYLVNSCQTYKNEQERRKAAKV